MAPSVRPIATSSSFSRSTGDATTPSRKSINFEHFAPSFHVGERIDVQIRTYIWVPGVVTNMAYSESTASLLYEVRYFAADGASRRELFYPRDIRRPE